MPVIILYFSHPAFPIKIIIGVRKKNNFDLSQHFHNMLSTKKSFSDIILAFNITWNLMIVFMII